MGIHPTIANLQEGEEIQRVIRRHWIVYMGTIGYLFVLVLSTAFVLAFKSSIESIIPVGLLDVALVIYWAIGLIFTYITWINNELDLIIITNKRVIGIDQIAFLRRDFSECSIEKVQEVNAHTKGLLSELFNFGTLTINTASESSDFIMHTVGEPMEAARECTNVFHKFIPLNPAEGKSV